MPSLLDTSIAKNYRKQQVPYSRFGSRKIVWFAIGHVDTRTEGYDLDDFKMNVMIDTIQTRGEIVTIGAPQLGNNWGRFTVGIFEDTFNNGNNDLDTEAGYNDMATTLQSALEYALEDGDVAVEQVYMYGSFNGDVGGWSTDSDYREYGTKAEFADNSYLHDNDNPLV